MGYIGKKKDKELNAYDFFLFQEIADRKLSESYLSKLLSDILQDHVEPAYANGVSSRSLRYGSITTMIVNELLEHKFSLLRSGHKSDYNDRSYIVSTVGGSLPGGRVLSGWENPSKKVYTPTLHSLKQSPNLIPGGSIDHASEPKSPSIGQTCPKTVPDNVIVDFMTSLYATNCIPYFKQSAKLWELLAVCTASLVMYLPDMNHDMKTTNNVITNKLIAALKSTGSVENGNELFELERWSSIIRRDFDMKNSSDRCENRCRCCDRQSKKIDDLYVLLSSMHRNQMRLEQRWEQELASNKQKISPTNAADNHPILSPSPSKRQRKFVEIPIDDANIETKATVNAFQKLKSGILPVGESSCTELRKVICLLKERNQFESTSSWGKLILPDMSDSNNKAGLRYTMIVAYFCSSLEEREFLRVTKNYSQKIMTDMATSIVAKVMNMVMSLEVRLGIRDGAKVRKTIASTYVAIGGRCKEIISSLKKEKGMKSRQGDDNLVEGMLISAMNTIDSLKGGDN